MRNVSEIPRGLCNQCGVCTSLCPQDIIRLRRDSYGNYFPEIVDKNGCLRKCTLCLDACPGISVDFDKLNLMIFSKLPEDYSIGNYRRTFLGYSCDHEIRLQSSSGGIATSLAIHALDSKVIDGVIVVRTKPGNPFEPEIIVARNRKDICSAMQSKYYPVPVVSGVGQLLRTGGRYGIIGLPCHIHAIRKAESISKKVKEKIVLRIGLFCSSVVDLRATYLQLRKFAIEPETVCSIMYRGGKWPGKIICENANGESRQAGDPSLLVGVLRYFFAPVRCNFCIDYSAELSDVSIGDAWNQDLKGDEGGWAVVISRSGLGETLLKSAEAGNVMSLRQLPEGVVKATHSNALQLKKRSIEVNKRFFRNAVPYYIGGTSPRKPTANHYMLGFLLYINICLSKYALVLKLMKYIPIPVFRIYATYMRLLNSSESITGAHLKFARMMLNRVGKR